MLVLSPWFLKCLSAEHFFTGYRCLESPVTVHATLSFLRSQPFHVTTRVQFWRAHIITPCLCGSVLSYYPSYSPLHIPRSCGLFSLSVLRYVRHNSSIRCFWTALREQKRAHE